MALKFLTNIISKAKKLRKSSTKIKEKEKTINLNGDKFLKFSQHIENDCVGVIDMIDSTRISSQLSDEKVTKMYEIFLNFMAKTIHDHNGEVLKNIGDALMFRFSNVNPDDSATIKNILECALVMTESHEKLDKLLKAENIPELGYRTSLTYGSVKVAYSVTSNISDVFGPTVNECFKINYYCPKNSLVIGENLYEILKNFDEYRVTKLVTSETAKKSVFNIFKVKRKD